MSESKKDQMRKNFPQCAEWWDFTVKEFDLPPGQSHKMKKMSEGGKTWESKPTKEAKDAT